MSNLNTTAHVKIHWNPPAKLGGPWVFWVIEYRENTRSSFVHRGSNLIGADAAVQAVPEFHLLNEPTFVLWGEPGRLLAERLTASGLDV